MDGETGCDDINYSKKIDSAFNNVTWNKMCRSMKTY